MFYLMGLKVVKPLIEMHEWNMELPKSKKFNSLLNGLEAHAQMKFCKQNELKIIQNLSLSNKNSYVILKVTKAFIV